MNKRHKHSAVIERYAGDLLLECFVVSDNILESVKTEGRLITAQESRVLSLLIKISKLLCDFADLKAPVNQN
jgi:hypothetical protein